MGKKIWIILALTAFITIGGVGISASAGEGKTLEGNGVQARFDDTDKTVSLYREKEDGSFLLMSRPSFISYPVMDGEEVSDFTGFVCEIEEDAQGTAGAGAKMTIISDSPSTGLRRICELYAVDAVEGLFYVRTSYEAKGDPVTVSELIDCKFALEDPAQTVWSYNGGGEGRQSYYDTLQKIDLSDNNTFYRENRQDETAVGVPAADIYSANGGITVGDASATRRKLNTPVEEKDGTVYTSIRRPSEKTIGTERTVGGEGFVHVHGGDYYMGLRGYADGMRRIGFETLSKDEIPDSSYDLRWESWGWEFDWTLELIYGKLDELQELGIKQVTLDDGWYDNAGEWDLKAEKLPNGDEDMKRLTDEIHKRGMTALLWWRPCDGGREQSSLYKEHPEYFVKNQDGTIGKLAGPGAFHSFNGTTGYALCPDSEGAVQAQVDFVKKAIGEWGFDGLKSDYVWSIPNCYNPAHEHGRPEESTENQAVFYREIYEAMRECNPNAFHLLCNCGTPQDYYSLPYVTQVPTADPTSVDQTRRRVKAYKALCGDYFPVTTDHNLIWYPSAVGTGSVLIEKRNMTGSEQEEYERWLTIAQKADLQRGEFIGNLYSYGFDPYETYVVKKDGVMHYAFYRDGEKYRPEGNPRVELKGLDPYKLYRIVDYVNDRVVATNVRGSEASLDCAFSSYLLLRAEELSAVDPVLSEMTAEETASDVTFEGTWTAESDGGFSGGGSSYTSEKGASVSLTFEGTEIAWYGQRDVNFGSAEVYIDGILQETVNCQGAASKGVLLYRKTDLAGGRHTIRIVCAKLTIDIDCFVYTKESAGGDSLASDAYDLAGAFTEDGFAQGQAWDAYAAAKRRLEQLLSEGGSDAAALEEAQENVISSVLELRKEVKRELLGALAYVPADMETQTRDITMLYRVMAYAEKLDMKQTIPAVQTEYQKALAQAKQVFLDADADQNTVNQAWAKLLNQIQYAGYIKGDKTELKRLLADYEKENLAVYQNPEAFVQVLAQAERIAEDENALENEISQVTDQLLSQHQALVKKNAPGQVTGIAVQSQTAGLSVTWQPQPQAASYTVFIFKDGSWQTAGTTAGTSFTVGQLKTGGKYQVKVSAANEAGEGQESEIFYTATKPAKPKIKSVRPYKASGLKISCKKRGETGFEVWIKTGKKAYKKAASGSKTVRLKKGVRTGAKVSLKIRGYVKNKDTKVYGAFRKVKF